MTRGVVGTEPPITSDARPRIPGWAQVQTERHPYLISAPPRMNRHGRTGILLLLLMLQHIEAATVTVTNAVSGMGRIVGAGTFDAGSPVQFRAVAQVDWRFDHWEGVPSPLTSDPKLDVTATPGLQPRAVFVPAPGAGRIPSTAGGPVPASWARLRDEFGMNLSQANTYPNSSTLSFYEDQFNPSTFRTRTMTLDEGGQLLLDGTPAGSQAAAIEGVTAMTWGNTFGYWIQLTPSGGIRSTSLRSSQSCPGPNSPSEPGIRYLTVGTRSYFVWQSGVIRISALRDNGVVDWWERDVFSNCRTTPTSETVLKDVDGLAQVAFDPPEIRVEQGHAFVLAPRVAGVVDRLTWLRDGVPIPAATQVALTATADATATFQLLAERRVSPDSAPIAALLTVPTRVRVLPDGFPRVLVDGKEVVDPLRLGGPTEVTLRTSFPDGQILYTLDGSIPTLSSKQYSGPFPLNRTAVIRAMALSADFTRIAMNDPVTVEVAAAFPLTVPVTGTGTVDVTPLKPTYLDGESVTLTARPGNGWRFLRWEGDASGAVPTLTLLMTAPRQVRAVFEPIPVRSVVVEAAQGTVLGAGSYPEGTVIQVGTVPFPGWQFTGWTGDHADNSPTFPWKVSGNVRFVAHFATEIQRVATGPGSIGLDPDLPSYPSGTEVRVFAKPQDGYYLALWGGAGAGRARGDWTLVVTNGQPKVSALFLPLGTDMIRIQATPTQGGEVHQPAADGIYPVNTQVTLVASATPGFRFAGWSGDATATTATLTLVASRNLSVVALFQPLPSLRIGPAGVDGRMRLDCTGPDGGDLVVETTSDLSHWSEYVRIVGRGTLPVRVVLPADAEARLRLVRLRLE